uniref:NB-ARC domain-containing protein n=1 Tax=Oryza punctata TaxID=4537 RepID=A0A0E0MED3_ORYPU
MQSLIVVSIVRFGGLGKTTLANEVYQVVGGQYDFNVFVSVSQKPDLKKLLYMIISKVGMQHHTCIYEVQDLMNYLREYLANRMNMIQPSMPYYFYGGEVRDFKVHDMVLM